MGDQETFKASVWYNGEVVNQDGNNPRYAGGTMKLIDVDPNTEVQVFLRTVRDISGIPEAVPITVKYHIFFSAEISKLLDITTSESLKSMLQPGLMLHPFYVEKNVVEDGTDTNEPKCRRSARKSKAIQSPPAGVEVRSARKSKAIKSPPTGVEICRRSARNAKAIQSPPTGVPDKPSAHVHDDGSLNLDQAPAQKPIPTRHSNKHSAMNRDDPADAVNVGDRVGGTSSTNSSRMQIIIRSICGLETTFGVKRTETVKRIKEEIRKMEGSTVEDFRLMYEGNHLFTGTLADYGIADGSVINLMHCQKGC